MIDGLLGWLGDSAWASAMAESPLLFPWVETAHVVAITLVLGTIFIVDLRLVGLASHDYSVSRLTRALLPLTWFAFAGALVTGFAMFASNPFTYAANGYFRAKLLLLIAAGFNMALFHLLTARSIKGWDIAHATPLSARFAGWLSIGLWIAITACGRWIGFTMDPF